MRGSEKLHSLVHGLDGRRNQMADNPIMPPPLPGQMPVISHKVLMRSSEEPLTFINSAEFAASGMDVFMDVGVVPVESVHAAAVQYKADPSKPAPVEFHVSYRFGMSLQSAIMIHQRLTLLIQQSAMNIQAMTGPPDPAKKD